MNVAITRAKHSLFVIGNSLTLSSDRNWNSFIKFCQNYDDFDDKIESKTYLKYSRNQIEKNNTLIENN